MNREADWAAAPRWDFTEHDAITKGGKKTEKRYQVIMIDGSPFEKPVALPGRPLSAAQAVTRDALGI